MEPKTRMHVGRMRDEKLYESIIKLPTRLLASVLSFRLPLCRNTESCFHLCYLRWQIDKPD